MDRKILTIGKAAKYLGVSVVTLRRWTNNGQIKVASITPGKHRYYNIDDLDRFINDIFILAKDWVFSKSPFEPQVEYYCPDQSTFQSQLSKLELLLKGMPTIGEEYSLISSIVGEMGNNSFDHNLGQWSDIRGIFFAYDSERKKIVLADRGQGLQKTLKRVKPEIKNDQDAMKVAFTEIISGRAPENRGNGLKYVRKIIVEVMKSTPIRLHFQSGSAILTLEQGHDYQISATEQTLNGCLIMLTY